MITPDNNETSLLIELINTFSDALLGAIAGVMAYLYSYAQAAQEGTEGVAFRVSIMIIFLCLGSFVSYLVGSTLPEDTPLRSAIIGLSGISAFQIIQVAHSKSAEWIFDRLTGGGAKK